MVGSWASIGRQAAIGEEASQYEVFHCDEYFVGICNFSASICTNIANHCNDPALLTPTAGQLSSRVPKPDILPPQLLQNVIDDALRNSCEALNIADYTTINQLRALSATPYECLDINLDLGDPVSSFSGGGGGYGYMIPIINNCLPGPPFGVRIKGICREVYDSTWTADPALGTAGETSSGSGGAMVSLCTQHHDKGGTWQSMNIPAVSYYGNGSSSQALAIIPENALWVRFFFEDKHFGEVPPGVEPYNASTYPMNSLTIQRKIPTEFRNDAEVIDFSKELGNGHCDPALGLNCDSGKLQDYSKAIWVGDISKSNPNLTPTENAQRRTLYGLSNPPSGQVRALLGSQQPGYKITRMEFIIP